jgi:hypothetical protein
MEIKGLLHTKKASGMDLVTPEMLKELPQKGMILLTYLCNAVLRHQYWPHKLKLAEIILLPKPSKNPKEVKSYRPISLLLIIAKLLEKLILCRIDPDNTIQQCHRITHTILKALNNKEYCTFVFLDVSQAFDKVWHPGLLYKMKKKHLPTFFPLLKSYLSN